jgi:hypothetical protein
VALAALEDNGPLTLGESPMGLDWQGWLTPSSLPHRLTPYKYRMLLENSRLRSLEG